MDLLNEGNDSLLEKELAEAEARVEELKKKCKEQREAKIAEIQKRLQELEEEKSALVQALNEMGIGSKSDKPRKPRVAKPKV